MSDKLIWEEPPPKRAGEKRPCDPRQQAMKDNPGRWLLFAEEGGTGSANWLRSRGFEVTMRETKNGRGRVYARWPAS